MKTITEFSGSVLRAAAQARAQVAAHRREESFGGAPTGGEAVHAGGPAEAAPSVEGAEAAAQASVENIPAAPNAGDSPGAASSGEGAMTPEVPKALATPAEMEAISAAVGVQGDRLMRLVEALHVVGKKVEQVRLVRVYGSGEAPANAKKLGEYQYVIDFLPTAAKPGRRGGRGERDERRGARGGGVGGSGGEGRREREPRPNEVPRMGVGWVLTREPGEERERERARGGPRGRRAGRPGGALGRPGGGRPGAGSGRGPRPHGDVRPEERGAAPGEPQTQHRGRDAAPSRGAAGPGAQDPRRGGPRGGGLSAGVGGPRRGPVAGATGPGGDAWGAGAAAGQQGEAGREGGRRRRRRRGGRGPRSAVPGSGGTGTVGIRPGSSPDAAQAGNIGPDVAAGSGAGTAASPPAARPVSFAPPSGGEGESEPDGNRLSPEELAARERARRLAEEDEDSRFNR